MPAATNQRKNEWVQRFVQLSGAPSAEDGNGEGAVNYVDNPFKPGKSAASAPPATASAKADALLGSYGGYVSGGSPSAEPMQASPSADAAALPVGEYVENLPGLSKKGASTKPAQVDSSTPAAATQGTGASAGASASAAAQKKPKEPHADPLRGDSKIAALLDEREKIEKKMRGLVADDNNLNEAHKKVEAVAAKRKQLNPKDASYKQDVEKLRSECERLIDSAVSGNKELEKLGKDYDAVSEQIENEVRRLNKQGVSPQQLAKEYRDEEKKVGWRADIWEHQYKGNSQLTELFRESTHLRTEYYDPKKRDESELQIGLDGKVRTSDGLIRGGARGEGQSEMVINPETGKMHEFKPSRHQTGEKGISQVQGGVEKDVTVFSHHSSVLAGKEVTGAGAYKTDAEGNLTQITNKSGHYKPGIAKLIQSVETLLQQGAFLDKSWVGADTLTGKEKELFTQADKGMSKASRLQVQVRQDTLAMDRVLQQNPNADVDAQAKAIAAKSVQLKKQLDALAKSQQILAKLGVSQKNKITGEVEYLDVGAGMTGMEVRQARTNTQGVQEFLNTGGGYSKKGEIETAGDHKKATLKELEAKTAKRRQELDAEAEKKATQGSSDLPHDVDEVLKELTAAFGEKKQGQGAAASSSPSQPSSSAASPAKSDHYSEPTINPQGGAKSSYYSEATIKQPAESGATEQTAATPSNESDDESSSSADVDPRLAAYKTTSMKQ